MRRVVLLPRPISAHAEALLDRHFEDCRPYRSRFPDAVLRDHAGAITAAAVSAAAGFPDALWEALPKLNMIAVHGVGSDGVDLEQARRRGVTVRFTPNILADDVADLAIGLWLTLTRKILDADRFVRSGLWNDGAAFPLSRQASGRRAGLVGLGHVGSAIARRLEAFGVSIAYTARAPKPDRPYTFMRKVAELAAWSDVLFLAAPEGADTQGIVGRTELEALGPSGLLVNVSRGALVDEEALADLLERGGLGGAGLDVFRQEPAGAARFATMGNVVLQPHLGSATEETRRLMARSLVDQIEAHFNGGVGISAIAKP